MKVTLKNVPATFVNIFEPDGKFNRYGFSAPIEPGSENAKKLQAAIDSVAKEKWGAKAKSVLEKIKEDGNICYLEKPKRNAEGDVYSGYADMYTFNASGTTRPAARDRDGKTPLVESDGKVYSGVIANLIVDIWPQDNQWGKRVNAAPVGFQFIKHGTPLGGTAVAEDADFEELEDADEKAGDDALI